MVDPAAHAFVLLRAATASSTPRSVSGNVGVATSVHEEPFQRIANVLYASLIRSPVVPTAQTSLCAVLDIPSISVSGPSVGGVAWTLQLVPLQCSSRIWFRSGFGQLILYPPAQPSFVPARVTAFKTFQSDGPVNGLTVASFAHGAATATPVRWLAPAARNVRPASAARAPPNMCFIVTPFCPVGGGGNLRPAAGAFRGRVQPRSVTAINSGRVRSVACYVTTRT